MLDSSKEKNEIDYCRYGNPINIKDLPGSVIKCLTFLSAVDEFKPDIDDVQFFYLNHNSNNFLFVVFLDVADPDIIKFNPNFFSSNLMNTEYYKYFEVLLCFCSIVELNSKLYDYIVNKSLFSSNPRDILPFNSRISYIASQLRRIY